MGKKKVTFADIAKYTNFSKTTISRYFNSPDSLTLENQEKIAKALDDLGYQENKLAKVLANGKSEFIGIIIPNLYLHYYSEMLNQLLSSYSDYHYKFLVFVSSDKKELEAILFLPRSLLPITFQSSQLNGKLSISVA